MSTDHSNPKIRSDSPTTHSHESDPDYVPRAWVTDGIHESLGDSETRYYAVLQTVEHEVHHGQLQANNRGAGEAVTLHVLYVRADGERAVERKYPGQIVDEGDRVVVDPDTSYGREWPASITIDDTTACSQHITPTPDIERALSVLYDCDSSGSDA